ncbi:hypothetical protein PoB_003014100 [Plakobranchus ocellatus]|uniref:Translin-associated factor X-interacting protein 1 N-terminal domain-containing protein n=1 Tax=Plakobranchus ocellatus TaxID=259542 RepID=A0AAV4A5U8_9GAST|nr:hypothetical protein PoB_003014100 [Plakobranchus ocellatus]
MAFKFILGHHIKSILNDAEEKQKKDIKDFAGGHLNESQLLRAPLSLNRKTWQSAKADRIHLTRASKPQHKPRVKKESGTPKEVLFDFSLGTTGVIPPVKKTLPQTPEVRYRKMTSEELAAERDALSTGAGLAETLTPQSVYTQLEDGVLIEELPHQQIMMPAPPKTSRKQDDAWEINNNSKVTSARDETPRPEDSGRTSQSSQLSRASALPSPLQFHYSVLPMQTSGITKRDQYRRMKAFDLSVLQKREMAEQNVLSGQKAARHHERKLDRELSDLNLNGIGPNFHRLQVFSNVLDDVVEESPTFNYILRCIKTEYDNYIAKLLDGQTSQQHLLRDQVDQMASRGTSRPGEMDAATQKLQGMEQEARFLLDTNEQLKEELKTERENLNKTPEVQTKRTPQAGGFSRKEEPVELSLELENMKALILEKLDDLKALRVQLREEYVPVTVCTHLEQCIKETEVEVQKLLKQNEYFERSIAEMDSDLKEAIVEADTSEKDARRIWHKVNSTRGMPGASRSSDSDDEDDESKWNWYIS